MAGLVPVVVLYSGSQWSSFGAWMTVASAASVLGWIAWALSPAERVLLQQTALLVMAVCGGLTSSMTGAGLITALVAVFAAAAQTHWSWPVAVVVAGAAAAATSAAATLVAAPSAFVVGQLAGIGVLALAGRNRRQFQLTAEQNRLFREQSRLLGAERELAAAAAERTRIARDVHDVLAHTLGGLVIQLDAAEALLEAGNAREANNAVKTSHGLAVSGLGEARRVVEALRTDWVDVRAGLVALVEHHRSTFGTVDFEIIGDTAAIGEPLGDGLLRAAQEALSNARRHGAGKLVRLSVRVDRDGVALNVENPINGENAGSRVNPSGWGLIGMRERIAALGGTVEARKVGAKWQVHIVVPLN